MFRLEKRVAEMCNLKLIQEGRKEEVNRVFQDDEYQEQLLREYHLK